MPLLTRFTIRVALPVESLNRKRGEHWTKTRRSGKTRREGTWLETRAQLMSFRHLQLDPRSPKRITFTAFVGRLTDPDNFFLKPYIDGLRDALVIHDDGPPETSGHYINDPPITQVLTREPKRRGLAITVELLSAAPPQEEEEPAP
jgi:hypothetical protein